MSDKTSIEWTDATFNPWWGCANVSPGCDHCYAETWAKRFGVQWGVDSARRTFDDKHWNAPRRLDARAAREDRRLRIFCASMADVFDKNAPEGARERLWKLIAETPSLDWQLLTKRIGNVPRMLPEHWNGGIRLPNVWLGITVVNQDEADRDIPKLLAIPARVRFLSCEPLLGPVQITRIPYRDGDPRHRQNALTGEAYLYATGINGHPDMTVKTAPVMPRLHWVISGGESGAKARPAHPDWFRSLRDQCAAAGVPYLFKQWGEWAERDGENDNDVVVQRVGKKAAGRILDGRTHDGFPA